MSSRFEQAYRVDGATRLTATLWNRIFRELDTRIVAVEEKKATFEEAERQLLQIGLDRINEALLPAAERIFRVAELGFLVASSDEEATFVEGQEASLTIREGDQRALFTPTEFVAISRRSTPEDWVIARTLGYSRESGVLLVRAELVKGSGGPHDDWDASATPGAAQAVVDLFEQVSSLRQEVADDKAAVAIDKAAAQSARTEAQNARDAAIIAKTDAESALASFMTVYRGALPSAPPDGEQGHFYFDLTLQMARVYTASGWAPLFQVSLGGIRQGFFEATNGQDEFTVAGGFSFLNVWVNGVLLTPGVDYSTASPDVTLTAPLSAGDQVAYTGYYATEVTDFYSKLDADGRFLRFDGVQTLTPEQQAQALANLGIDPWAVQPIGVPIPVFDHIPGVSLPPTDKGYRYVSLVAGQTGPGLYNEGILTNESVSGSVPLVTATAVIALAASPMYGQTISLIGTERRFIRAGWPGALQDDAFQSHRHGYIGSYYVGRVDGTVGTGSAPISGYTTTGIYADGPDGTPRIAYETRPRNIGATYFMRIR